MKYLILLSAALLFGAVACTEEKIESSSPTLGEMREVFFDAETIDMEDAGEIDVKNTRSMMREGGEIYWNANDMLGVFTQNGSPQKFKTANGGKVTRFEGYNDVEGEFYVLYPFNEGARLEGNIISTELSAVQYPEPGCFYNGGNILLAKTRQGETAFFHNVCTWVRISISEDYAGTITGMVLEGNNGELLAGDVTIDTTLGNDARISVCDSEKASKKIVMNTEDHFYQGKYYYFILPPQTFEKGVTVTFLYRRDVIHLWL